MHMGGHSVGCAHDISLACAREISGAPHTAPGSGRAGGVGEEEGGRGVHSMPPPLQNAWNSPSSDFSDASSVASESATSVYLAALRARSAI